MTALGIPVHTMEKGSSRILLSTPLWHDDALIHGIYAELRTLGTVYPRFGEWFFRTVVPGLHRGERQILIERRHEKIAGIAIVKNDGYEKKICTVRVSPEFKNRGLGVRIFSRCIELLDTAKPLASVSDDRLPEFERIFAKLNFDLCQSYSGLYRPDRSELAFNGLLVPTLPKQVRLRPQAHKRRTAISQHQIPFCWHVDR